MSISRANKQKLRRRIKIISAVMKLVLLLVILIAVPVYIYFFHYDLIERFSNMENVNALFREYKAESVLFYIGAQILQIVICIIPGQWLQFAAGYIYGFWLGYLLSLVGAAIGTVFTYYIARFLGHDAMHLIFGEEKIHQMLNTLNSKKAVVLVFLIFLIPGVPKDLCNYVAGLSEMKLKRFMVVSLIGRSPGMMGSLLIGLSIVSGKYVGAGVIAAVAVVLFVLGIIFRRKITSFLDKAYDRLMKL
ncbi:MAG: TVP38/TMEM64 family protein [Lentihominibacter sp.]